MNHHTEKEVTHTMDETGSLAATSSPEETCAMDTAKATDIATLLEKLKAAFRKQPAVVRHEDCGRVGFDVMDDGSVFYLLDGRTIHGFHSEAVTADGRRIHTGRAERNGISLEASASGCLLTLVYHQNGLTLTQIIETEPKSSTFTIQVVLSATEGKVETNYLAPLAFLYPNVKCDPLFLSLEQRMLLVPYDNDMWVRYESTPLRPGRTSYEVTAVYGAMAPQQPFAGLVVGALDFDCWKNAIACSAHDARCYTAFSGVADACTHDVVPHGTMIGEAVSSARFLCGWHADIRDGLEAYGRHVMRGKPAFTWTHGVPFGWNSYSALAIGTTLGHWREASAFIDQELSHFRGGEDTAYINLDATFGLDEAETAKCMEEIHARRQKAGTYMAPLMLIPALDFLPFRGSDGTPRKAAVMTFPDGTPYPKTDGSLPLDITHPDAERDLRLSLRAVAEKGYDYLKIDFLSHGALEGTRHDPSVRTGRQALMRFYHILAEELDPVRIGRDIFVSLSIAPLFPCGYGHARRSSCDAFGHHEDVRYILNALTFGWWTSGSLYCYADPDHTVLYHSEVDGRGCTDEASARSRYHAAVISGTVLLLSDNYGPEGDVERINNARTRTRQLADNADLNAVARIGRPFRPVSLTGDASEAYFLHHEGRHYLAMFNFDGEMHRISAQADQAGMPRCGTARTLHSGLSFAYDTVIAADLGGYDSVILELTES